MFKIWYPGGSGVSLNVLLIGKYSVRTYQTGNEEGRKEVSK